MDIEKSYCSIPCRSHVSLNLLITIRDKTALVSESNGRGFCLVSSDLLTMALKDLILELKKS